MCQSFEYLGKKRYEDDTYNLTSFNFCIKLTAFQKHRRFHVKNYNLCHICYQAILSSYTLVSLLHFFLNCSRSAFTRRTVRQGNYALR